MITFCSFTKVAVLSGEGEIPYADRDNARRSSAAAGRIPIGAADRYAVLSAPSASDRLAALREAVEALTEMVEFQLSE